MSFYRVMYTLLNPLVRLCYRLEIRGEENIPTQSGCILAANHTAFSDVLIVSAAARRQVRYMAKRELFRIPLLGFLIRVMGAYPVNRGGADVSSIKYTIELIESGELIGIFPQGHRHGYEDPRQTEVKGGIGLIEYHTKATVLPVYIDNKRGKTGIFRKNTVIFGKPVAFEDLDFTPGGSKGYMNVSREIFRRICALKFGEDTELAPMREEPARRKARKDTGAAAE